MRWFASIFVFILFCQSKCDRNEAKEDQPNGLSPLFLQQFNPIQTMLKDKSLENCQSPLCTIAQQFFRPDQLLSPYETSAHPGAPVPAGATEECANCPGPNCRCRPNDPSVLEQSLSLFNDSSINRQRLPFPVRVVCFLNRIGLIPSVHLTFACLFAEIVGNLGEILRELLYKFRSFVRFLPFGRFISGIDNPPYKPNTPNYPVAPTGPVVSIRKDPMEPLQQPAETKPEADTWAETSD